MQKLTTGKDNWSISELVHALILLAHFHALSSFVYGCGITPEVDHEGGYTYSSKSSPSTSNNSSRSTSKHTSPSSSFTEVRNVLIKLYTCSYIQMLQIKLWKGQDLDCIWFFFSILLKKSFPHVIMNEMRWNLIIGQ